MKNEWFTFKGPVENRKFYLTNENGKLLRDKWGRKIEGKWGPEHDVNPDFIKFKNVEEIKAYVKYCGITRLEEVEKTSGPIEWDKMFVGQFGPWPPTYHGIWWMDEIVALLKTSQECLERNMTLGEYLRWYDENYEEPCCQLTFDFDPTPWKNQRQKELKYINGKMKMWKRHIGELP